MTAPPPSFGSLLAHLRQRRGWSQLRLAEHLCAASCVPTVSRHEISRWERQERVPGEFWLGWLAVVLETAPDELVEAAAASRAAPRRHAAGPRTDLAGLAHAWVMGADPGWLAIATAPAGWSPDPVPAVLPAPGQITAPAGRAGPRGRGQATGHAGTAADDRHGQGAGSGRHGQGAGRAGTAADGGHGHSAGSGGHGHSAGPGGHGHSAGSGGHGQGAGPGGHGQGAGRAGTAGDGGPSAGLRPDDLADRLAAVRRLDDVVGGVDLAALAGAWLADAVPLAGSRPPSRRQFGPLAEAGQLLGWTRADAGDPAGALAAYRRALAAAVLAGDRPLAGHVLGSASHLLVAGGDPRAALGLARAAGTGCRQTASATGRALLLHRVAAAAAACGQRATAHAALAAAQRAGDARDPGRDPAWLYWLDGAELDALAGRCLAALGRPAQARPLLARAAARCGRPRTAALDRAWLARALLDLGEVDAACAAAGDAIVEACRAGSARAVDQVDRFDRRLLPHRRAPAARLFADRLAAARPYLPRSRATGPRPATAAGAS